LDFNGAKKHNKTPSMGGRGKNLASLPFPDRNLWKSNDRNLNMAFDRTIDNPMKYDGKYWFDSKKLHNTDKNFSKF
jgi:hypothetical protein